MIQSAMLNGHDPYAYLKDVLTRLPTHKVRNIDELLPHRWVPTTWVDKRRALGNAPALLP